MIDFFDSDLAIDSGVCSFATRQKGKTNLFKLLVRDLLAHDVQVTVFDPSQAWLTNTPLKHMIVVTPELTFSSIPECNMVYDISRLTRPDSREFVNSIVALDLEKQMNIPKGLRRPKFYVFEESQIFLSSQSVKWMEECYRLVTIGANFRMSYGLISQRPASIDTECISRCGQIFVGNLWEQNDLRKIQTYLNYSRTETYEVISHLPTGVFVKIQDGHKQIVSVPLFKGQNATEPIVKKPSLIQTVKSLIRL